ncbi:lipid phosphate phosphohydrolase 3 [Plakobranchus ocellatus]|uniref:Lipid phosphate phosphohydrolase 3 n=1 Tax=Plakobranchus ocellatus TaxID=259542 RepID=A0AAV4BY27_9GAST|nr:lipid phosphate phosphohydrolase 3 [Plakobranchus ocellatus]
MKLAKKGSDEVASFLYHHIVNQLIIERGISSDFFALKVTVQGSYIIWAIYVSTSRIKDNKNHPVDTLAGFLLGTFMALVTDYVSNYQDYQDIPYDPTALPLNLRDWEVEAPTLDDRGNPMGTEISYL